MLNILDKATFDITISNNTCKRVEDGTSIACCGQGHCLQITGLINSFAKSKFNRIKSIDHLMKPKGADEEGLPVDHVIVPPWYH